MASRRFAAVATFYGYAVVVGALSASPADAVMGRGRFGAAYGPSGRAHHGETDDPPAWLVRSAERWNDDARPAPTSRATAIR